MPWFKVDDDLAFHRKVVAAGNAAMGLWVRAGAWSAQHLTDGFVPDSILILLGTAPQRKKLIEVKLWIAVEGGIQFHEWNESGRQPTAKTVRIEREKAADRQRAWRAAKTGRYTANSEDPQVTDTGHGVSHGVSHGGSHVVTNGVSNGRPDPTRPEPKEEPPPTPPAGGRPRKRGTRIPDPFLVTPEMHDWARQHTPLVGQTETDAFIDYWRAVPGQKGCKLDWLGTWRNWMRRAQADTERRGGRGHLRAVSGGSPEEGFWEQ